MIPRSQAGRAIAAEVVGESRTQVQAAPDRVTRLEKANRDVKLGLRFGLHPQTKQARAHPRALCSSRPAAPPIGTISVTTAYDVT